MKITRRLALSMLILTLTLVATSCDVADLLEETVPHSVENQIDNSFDKNLDKLEDRIENEHRAVSQERNEPTEFLPQEFQPVDTHRGEGASRVVDVALNPEDAEGIALAHAELTAVDVLYLHTEPDVEKGIPVYEVEFAVDLTDHFEHLEYEYTIHADTGEILEFDKERD
jgi:uncharacterized membrane protein YkoI